MIAPSCPVVAASMKVAASAETAGVQETKSRVELRVWMFWMVVDGGRCLSNSCCCEGKCYPDFRSYPVKPTARVKSPPCAALSPPEVIEPEIDQ